MPDFRNFMRSRKRKQTWARTVKHFVKRRIPISDWIRHYTREDALGDLIAGTTIALMITPQSIAYAALAGLDPQYGLNSAFMGCFIYVFFGTVKEIVIGPSSLMALLTYQYTSHLNVDFVVLLTFLAGVVEFLMGVFQLGFLVSFIPAPVVSGFTTATALIVAISQLKGLLGLRLKSLGIFDNLSKIAQNINDVRLGDTVLGIICIVCLLLLRKLKDVKVSSRVKGHKLIHGTFWFISTGRNAISVITTSCITLWYLNNDQEPPFITTKHVESGIPTIMVPPTTTQIGNQTYSLEEMVSELGMGYIIIPIVSVLANIAIAKFYVNGAIDASQEIMVLSVCNMVGSFFQAIPSSGAFTRSSLLSASGVRTPMAGLYAAGLTLMALQFLTPFFHLIPRSTLSAVLIAAVIFLVDWEIFKPLWKAGASECAWIIQQSIVETSALVVLPGVVSGKCCKTHAGLELATLVLTAFVGLFTGVELGLLFGTAVGMATLIYKWARPRITVSRAKTQWGEYIMVRPELGILFPSVDYIFSFITTLVEENDDEKLPIIMDCKEIRDTDYTAAKGFKALLTMFDKKGQQLVFLDTRSKCQRIWKSAGIQNESFWVNENLMANLYGCTDFGEDENSVPLMSVTTH